MLFINELRIDKELKIDINDAIYNATRVYTYKLIYEHIFANV